MMKSPEKDKNDSGTAKSTPESGNYLVCQGAVCQCSFGGAPAQLKIDNTKYYANGKPLATVRDITFVPPGFTTCSANPLSYKCIFNSTKGVEEWTIKGGEEHPTAGGVKVLTTSGQIICPEKKGIISVLLHGQVIPVPNRTADRIPPSVLMSVNCLMPPKTDIIEEREKNPKKIIVKSVSGRTDCKYDDPEQEATYNTGFSRSRTSQVRTGTPLTFKADADGDAVNWAVIEEKGGKASCQNIYMGAGREFGLAFVAPGTYIVVAFGRNPFEFDGKKSDRECHFRFNVSDGANSIESVLVLEDGKEVPQMPYLQISREEGQVCKQKETGMKGCEISKGKEAHIKVHFKYPPVPQELENLRISICLYGKLPCKIFQPHLLPEWQSDRGTVQVALGNKIHTLPASEPASSLLPRFPGTSVSETSSIGYLQEHRGTDTVEFTPQEETCYHVRACLDGTEEKGILLFARNNDSLKIEVKPEGILLSENGKIRPGTRLEFTCDPEGRLPAGTRIIWLLEKQGEAAGRTEMPGRQYRRTFSEEGVYRIRAYAARPFGIFPKTKADGETGRIQVCANKITDILIPQSATVGAVLTFRAETVFGHLTAAERITWRIQADTLQPRHNDMNVIFTKSGEYLLSPEESEVTKNDRKLAVKFIRTGTYSITASLGDASAVTKKITVDGAKIVSWCFTDRDLTRRPKIGWNTEFYVYLQVLGWENRNLKVTVWYDNRKRCDGKSPGERHKVRFVRILRFDATADARGCVRHAVAGDGQLWKELDRQTSGGGPLLSREQTEAALFFTVSGIETVCDCRPEIYNSPFMEGHIYPRNSAGTYTYAGGPDFQYDGFFAREGGDVQKEIIRYGEPVKIKLFVNNPKHVDPNSYKYRLKIIENLPGEDRAVSLIDAVPDRQGRIEADITAEFSLGDHDARKPRIPRFFYFRLERAKAGGDRYDAVYTYPKRYPTGRDNDRNIIALENDAHTAAEYRERRLRQAEFQAKYRLLPAPGSVFPLPCFSVLTNPDGTAKTQEQLNQEAEAILENQEKAEASRVNRQARAANREILGRNMNYYYQLKIAVEPEQQRKSFHNAACPVIIGESRTVQKPDRENECFCRRNKFLWGDRISCAGRKKVLEVCAELWGEENKTERAGELMAVMHLESRFSPKADNGRGYVGLVQFGKDSAGEIGTTQAALKKMDFVTQMDYVKKYIEYWAIIKKIEVSRLTLVDLYLIVLMPIDVGRGSEPDHAVFDDSLTLTGEQEKNKSGLQYVRKKGYRSNPVFMKEESECGDKNSGKGCAGGKTYIWEIDREITENHKKPGMFTIFRGKCEENEANNTENPDGWYDPVKNPQIAIFSQSGDENPRNQVFGMTGGRPHEGLDLFAVEGTPVYACLSGKIVHAKSVTGKGNTIVIEVSDPKQLEIFRNRRRDYTLAYEREGEKKEGAGFAPDSPKIYFVYMHLSTMLLSAGMEVSAGTQIGTSGITGIDKGTMGPHLHFEIRSENRWKTGLQYKINPGFYVYYMTAEELKQAENAPFFKAQEERKNKGRYNK